MNLLVSTVEASIVLAVGLVVVALLKSRSAETRHWVLSAAVVGACLAPLAGMVTQAWHFSPLPPAWQVSRWSEPEFGGVEPAAGPANLATRAPMAGGSSVVQVESPWVQPMSVTPGLGTRLVRMAFWVWGLGAGVSLVLLLLGLARLRSMTKTSARIRSGQWYALAEELSTAAGLGRRVTLFQSEHPALLMTWGCLHPRVMLPAPARDWSAERIRIVLGHELAHIRRGDWAIQLVAECLRITFWFNPLAWVVCARLRHESELACDDSVLRQGVEGTTYAIHLLALARVVTEQKRVWLPAPAVARPTNLERRVAAMLNPRLNRDRVSRLGRVGATLAFVAVAVVVAGLTGAAQSGSVSGVVLDQTGRAIPAASVSLTERESRDRQTVEVDVLGRFEFRSLDPGSYSLTISRPGFARLFQRVSVEAGEQLKDEVTLELGSLEETIIVTEGVAGARPSARDMSPVTLQRMRDNLPSGQQIRPPIKIRDMAAAYPEALRESGFEGKVVLEALVKADGFVEVLQILAPVDPVSMAAIHPDLARSAVEAVGQWRYEPTRLHDVPVDTPMMITVNFRPAE